MNHQRHADNHPNPKGEGDNPSHKWRDIFSNSVGSLHNTSWIQNLVVGLIFFLTGPAFTYFFMSDKKYMVYSVAIGVTIFIWILAFAITKEIGKSIKPNTPISSDVQTPNRAYLVIQSASVLDMIADKRLAARITIYNSGNMLAKFIVIKGYILLTNTLFDDYESTKKRSEETLKASSEDFPKYVAPNIPPNNSKEFTLYITDPINQEAITAIKNEKLYIYVIGDIVYNDGNEQRFVNFHYRYFSNDLALEIQQGHNDSN